MKNAGNWGLKQARYEISCRLLAARCLLVQNSFVSTGTITPVPLSIEDRLVGRPCHSKVLSVSTNSLAVRRPRPVACAPPKRPS